MSSPGPYGASKLPVHAAVGRIARFTPHIWGFAQKISTSGVTRLNENRQVTGLICGFVVGITQWLAIARDVPQSFRWIWRTSFGFSISYAVFASFSIFFLEDPMVKGIFGVNRTYFDIFIVTGVIALVSGAVIGVMQWSILRKYFQSSERWIWINCLVWAMHLVSIMVIMGLELPVLGMIGQALMIMGIAWINGAVTGVVLVWLLDHPKQCENPVTEN